MQTFLKILGFITIFIGIIAGIYVIADALSVYASLKGVPNPYMEQVYLIKLVAGGAIILSSIVSGMLYLSFGIVIELLDSLNHRIIQFLDALEKAKNPKKDDEFSF
jgi:TRAP-type C4-dicarboxylate transport system permease small subunit